MQSGLEYLAYKFFNSHFVICVIYEYIKSLSISLSGYASYTITAVRKQLHLSVVRVMIVQRREG